ncbi:hypothetical protein Mkiyose1385_25370 [Mycobacterium kiyosense]|uniref:hypothetical protein n=1 Tax=Mycobacterium kiyosense TaxID=2871094 RepID=UPI00217235D8|nr:hypothetical protein [Mycobacterium kiyosense]GLD18438.1 hypothetical protein Mkiyose1385_25370 [Mycobacterium kiyosense]
MQQTQQPDRIANQSNLYQNISFAFCVLFGLAMIANTHAASDGVWYWYSVFFAAGKHLYSDMHLVLQPVYVLETSAFMAVLGKGWLVSKIPAVLHLVAYCLALRLLMRRTSLSDAGKGIVLACAFFVTVSFEAYRFDDYHVLADCFVLYSLLALLALQKASSAVRAQGMVALLGALSGLALTTRPNDGAALIVAVVLGIMCLAPARKLLSLLAYGVATGLTVQIVVALTGDSLHDYVTSTLLNAAGNKGGTLDILLHPLRLPWSRVVWLCHGFQSSVAAGCAFFALIWVFALRPLGRKHGWKRIVFAAVGLAMMIDWAYALYVTLIRDNVALVIIYSPLVILAYGLCLWVGWKFILWLLGSPRVRDWDTREILIFIPLGQLASASMSSGESHFDLYSPVAVLIVVLAICSPIHVKKQWIREFLYASAVLLICSTVVYRFHDPCHWHTYSEKPMFSGRTVYHHPDYGPMVISTELLHMIKPVCETIEEKGPDNDLLSIPLPYANYFCAIPPWNNAVQTFFDISCEQTIQNLITELRNSPPKWIFLQRELKILRLHEVVYNHGNPLPHRLLNDMIEQKINDGAWKVVYTSDFGNSVKWDNKWLLIQTR